MRVVSSVMCVLKFGPRPQADPGHNSKSAELNLAATVLGRGVAHLCRPSFLE